MSSSGVQVRAVLLALLVVFATVGPATAAQTSRSPDSAVSAAVSQPQTTPSDNTTQFARTATSALGHRVLAFRALDASNHSDAERLAVLLNGTFDAFYDRNRTRRSTYRTDKKVAAAAQNVSMNVTRHVVESDAILARTALRDARQASKRLDARGVEYDRSLVQDHLAAAESHLARARHVRENSPVGSIEHYRKAWSEADAALQHMDEATAPRVTITSREDPRHNGTVTYVVRGTVFDVRPLGIRNLTVAVDGENHTIPVRLNTTAAGESRFAVRVNLTDDVNRVVVTAVERHDAESSGKHGPGSKHRKNEKGNDGEDGADGKKGGKGNGKTGNGEEGSGETEKGSGKQGGGAGSASGVTLTGSATLLLDGDGLPDEYERSVTGTAPLDPDSDAANTTTNESGDDVADGVADFDGDDLTTLEERRLGTDPLDSDSDGDGLPDRYELVATETDPLVVDTAENGTADGMADPDGDSLSNVAEFEAGTNPLAADSDADDSSDAVELDIGTNPRNPDTDGDGLLDGVEPAAPFETDPMLADTDGDGILDGNETFTSTTSNETVGASVTASGNGSAVTDVSIENGNESVFVSESVESSSVSEQVVLDGSGAENATLSLATGNASDLSNVSMYRYNRTAQTYESVSSEVDGEGRAVSANVSTPGLYVVLDVPAWESGFEDPLPENYSETGDFENSSAWSCGEGEDGGGECQTKGEGITIDGGGGGADSSSVQSFSIASAPPDGGFTIMKICIDTPEGTKCDTDWDGTLDEDDDCVTTPGAGPNGCPIDSDGDGLDDLDDACPDRYAKTSDGCPNSGGGGGGENPTDPVEPSTSTKTTYTREVTFTRGNVEIMAEASISGSATGSDAQAALIIKSEETGNTEMFSLSGSDGETVTDSTTGTWDFSDYFGETVKIRLVAKNDSQLDVDYFRLTYHSDSDGISDNVEMSGIRTGRTDVITLDPHSADTDGDDLTDDEEVGERYVFRGRHYYTLNSHPKKADTDGDGLNDSNETNGWTVDVEMRNGEPYRYHNDSSTTMHVSSDPWLTNSDGDQASDYEERHEYMTDPEATVTYGITREHQAQIVEPLAAEWRSDASMWSAGRTARAIGLVRAPETLSGLKLNDTSDDFDFLTVPGERVPERLTFRALDNEERSDTWLSNRAEVGLEIDLHDPDTDNDGLTDGQEVKGITLRHADGGLQRGVVNEMTDRPGLGTSPRLEDSDGDGYWDGWIGVYNASNSTNVVLYAEHLEGGISPSEAVDAQVGVHNEWEAPMARGANVTGGPEKEHSNVHLGELHWGSDPRDSLDTSASAASLDFEVDWLYDENVLSGGDPISHDPRNIRNPDTNATLLEDVKQNYALYGINVTFHRDDQVNSSDLHTVYKGQVGGTPTFVSPDSMNAQELNAIRERYHDNRSRVHLFFSNNYRNDLPMFLPHDVGIPNGVWGLTGHTGSPTQVAALEKTGRVPYGVVIMNETMESYQEKRETTLHELGHTFGAGYLDDKAPQIGECYSGTECVLEPVFGSDNTPEDVSVFARDSWSIMSIGTRPVRMNSSYNVFSIEELMSVDTQEVPSRDD